MRSRLLVLAAAVGSLAAPLSAQTIFNASGGDVIVTPTSMGFTPFQLFADYLGLHRLIAESDGTLFTLDTRGAVAISSFNTLGPLTIATLSPGASIFFTYVINGTSSNTTFFYRQTPTGFNLTYAPDNATDPLRFGVAGIASATNLQCPGAQPIGPGGPITCSLLTPVTSTPEPGTIALFATGLAGLIPVMIRRRRATGQPSR